MVNELKTSYLRDVYIVDGLRTPFLKSKNKPGPFSASDLAVSVGRTLLNRQPFSQDALDEVIIGCMIPSTDEANIGRVIALRLGCSKKIPAYTVQRNCASGMQALDSAAKDIALGRCNLVLAGGCESMSHAPLLLSKAMTMWLANLTSAKGFKAKLKGYAGFKPYYLKPIIALIRGLTDPLVNLSMGQTAENIAYRFHITRKQMDEFALTSHVRAAQAQDKHYLDEITPLFDTKGELYLEDNGVRRDSTLEKLEKLSPFFDKKFGKVTAANSSQVSDGAALLLLASADAIKKYKLPVLAKINALHWAGVDPTEMGLGPVHAVALLLNDHHLKFDDIDYWEINEAFAGQVLACLSAFASDEYCKNELDLSHALGTIDHAKLNVDGGAVAIGHPVGASGARLALHLAKVLRRNNARNGIATLCIGGGQGGAMLIENVSEVI